MSGQRAAQEPQEGQAPRAGQPGVAVPVSLFVLPPRLQMAAALLFLEGIAVERAHRIAFGTLRPDWRPRLPDSPADVSIVTLKMMEKYERRAKPDNYQCPDHLDAINW